MVKNPQSDREIIKRQITALLDDAVKRTTVATAIESHREPVSEPESDGFVRTPMVAVSIDETPLLVVPGHILVDDEHAQATRALLGPDFSGPERITCPSGTPLPVVRFNSQTADLAVTTDALHDAGIPANFSYVTPSGPYMKSAGGAEYPSGATPEMSEQEQNGVGEGCIRVAIIDTGINVTDTEWGKQWLRGVTVTDGNRDPLNAISKGPLDNGGGHGTFVAGIIRQIAPKAQIRIYRALDSDGVGSEEAVACAILKAVDDGVDIINLSLGTETYKDRPPVALNAALELVPEEVVVVAAAGNDGSSRPNWPAAFKRVVAVAGLDQDLKRTQWSNRGSWIDMSTVGEGVVSTFVVGFESKKEDPDPEDWRPTAPWAMWTGTSFAAPQIVGLIARAAETSDAGQALAELRANGSHVADVGVAVPSPLTYTVV